MIAMIQGGLDISPIITHRFGIDDFQKGFDAMTVDEVAADVGIAKASLYKHFPSKEDLAAAAMVFVMRRAQQYLDELPTQALSLIHI